MSKEHPADSDVGQRLLANDAAISLLLEGEGYHDLVIEPIGGEFVASATKVVGVTPYKAAALGRTRADAARALVKTITRP